MGEFEQYCDTLEKVNKLGQEMAACNLATQVLVNLCREQSDSTLKLAHVLLGNPQVPFKYFESINSIMSMVPAATQESVRKQAFVNWLQERYSEEIKVEDVGLKAHLVQQRFLKTYPQLHNYKVKLNQSETWVEVVLEKLLRSANLYDFGWDWYYQQLEHFEIEDASIWLFFCYYYLRHRKSEELKDKIVLYLTKEYNEYTFIFLHLLALQRDASLQPSLRSLFRNALASMLPHKVPNTLVYAAAVAPRNHSIPHPTSALHAEGDSLTAGAVVPVLPPRERGAGESGRAGEVPA